MKKAKNIFRKIWKKLAGSGRSELMIGFYAALAWLAFYAGSVIFGWESYPVAYFQKIAFGIVGMSIISGVAWIWLDATFPKLKDLIDPDTAQYKLLDLWQQLKIALFFWGCYVGGSVLLASLY